jgi:hypothetical protein
MESIRDIDTSIQEGKVLLVTLSRLSCMPGYSNKHPDEILSEMVVLAMEVFEDES